MWFRIYQIDDRGHICGADNVQCADDGEAIAAARAAAGRKGVEVWQGARQVAVLPASTPSGQCERRLRVG
jgi:hypothetical protein